MACKRKRPRSPTAERNPTHAAPKRTCLGLERPADPHQQQQQSFQQPVLSLYFPKHLTLRAHLHQVLASGQSESSRCRLRELQAIGPASDQELSHLLDSALVGLCKDDDGNPRLHVQKEVAAPTQQSSGSGCYAPQSEIVDRVLHILFRRSYISAEDPRHAVFRGRPNHILCLGFTGERRKGALFDVHVNKYPNSHVNALKSQKWDRLLQVIGEPAMVALLLETSIFVPLSSAGDRQIYYQLSGPPISDSLNTPTVFPATTATSARRSNSGGSGGRISLIRETLEPLQGCSGGRQSLKRSASEIERPAAKKKATNSNGGGGCLVSNKQNATPDRKSHGEIVFVRSRIFYARPAHNKKREVQFGLPHIHALNRFRNDAVEGHARCLLMYMFPRQHGLHNVFTSEVNRNETSQAFQDYTVRQEVDSLLPPSRGNSSKNKPKEVQQRAAALPPLPKRLKGNAQGLVKHMQKLHQKCSYHALVKYYCPSPLCDAGARDNRIRLRAPPSGGGSGGGVLATQEEARSSHATSTGTDGVREEDHLGAGRRERFTEFASSSGEASGFVKAAIRRVIPNEFFGSRGTSTSHNKDCVMRTVDRFVKLRRFESFSLHEALQGLKLTDVGWLRPPSMGANEKMSGTDGAKRRQLLAEFVYWLLDSFVIPLLRAHFYITESNVDRNRVFYFRHDVWEKLSKPTLDTLRTNMFEEMEYGQAERMLASRTLGFSQIRLLPKQSGIRTITNLKRKGTKIVDGKIKLTPGINTIMKPVYRILLFEKERDPERVGNCIFSVTEMYPRIKEFKQRIDQRGWGGRKLYFAKVDVQGCFDTIPQSKLLRLVNSFLGEDEYRIASWAEVLPPPPYQVPSKNGSQRPERRFHGRARPADEFEFFADFAAALEKVKPGTVLVDDVQPVRHRTADIVRLLISHVKQNIIKIGKKYYRQKTGIPQGSILSSILCNFFYAQLERERLPFVHADDSLLLRLTDDFLLITLDRSKATGFLRVMHAGNDEYGAFVNADKSLVNFETTVLKKKVPRLVGTLEFPYCRTVIHTQTLNIGRERERRQPINIDNALTVDYSRRPGSALLRKTIAAFKLLAHDMYFDTELNSLATVVRNIHQAFAECAMKFHRYVRSLRRLRAVPQLQLVVCVRELLGLAWTMIRRRQKGADLVRAHVTWLGANAFRKVLARKQSGYRLLLGWLAQTEKAEGRQPARAELDLSAFEAYRY